MLTFVRWRQLVYLTTASLGEASLLSTHLASFSSLHWTVGSLRAIIILNPQDVPFAMLGGEKQSINVFRMNGYVQLCEHATHRMEQEGHSLFL